MGKVHVHVYPTTLLPKEIFEEPFGLLTLKVRSPSHFLGAPDKICRGQSWGLGKTGKGRGVVVSCGNLGEGPGDSPFLSVEIFHETLIWSNTV